MRTSIFATLSTFFFVLTVVINPAFIILRIILLCLGVFLFGVSIGGLIANSIWKKYIEAKEVLRALGYETKIK
jgi:hypothetical protein